MIIEKFDEKNESVRVYFSNEKNVGVILSRSTIIYIDSKKNDYEFHMRFFYKDEVNNINFGNQDKWKFIARKDFLVRKNEVEKKIIKLLHYKKEFILNKLFKGKL